jgi:hypothetical protein
MPSFRAWSELVQYRHWFESVRSVCILLVNGIRICNNTGCSLLLQRQRMLLVAADHFRVKMLRAFYIRLWRCRVLERHALEERAVQVVAMSARIGARVQLRRWRRVLAVQQRGALLLQRRLDRVRVAYWQQWRIAYDIERRINGLKVKQ